MESSRIFVHGLPTKFSEDDVRKHFSFPSKPTDVKYFPHRRIGYVGYKTPEDAVKAVKYFNKTFIKLTKIYVEPARPVCTLRPRRGQAGLTMQIADKELPLSRRQLKAAKNASSADEWRPPPRQENELKRKRDEAEQDPKLKEFLEVYQPPSKNSIWANGDGQLGQATVAPAEETVPEIAASEDESEYQVIAKKSKLSEPTPTPAVPEPAPTEAQPEVAGTDEVMEDVHEAPTAEQGAVSDADWLRSRTNRVLELVEDDEVRPTAAPATTAPTLQATVERIPPHVITAAPEPHPQSPAQDEHDAAQAEEDKIRVTGRLYLRNLSFDVTEDELREQFSKHGELEEVSKHSFISQSAYAMMNVKIGTTDASAPEVTL
jgi:multiple RNA-binding domain-containing protein 1